MTAKIAEIEEPITAMTRDHVPITRNPSAVPLCSSVSFVVKKVFAFAVAFGVAVAFTSLFLASFANFAVKRFCFCFCQLS